MDQNLLSLLTMSGDDQTLGVVPVLVGPLQALITILPGLLVALGGIVVSMFKPTAMKRLALILWSQKFIILLIVALLLALIYLYTIVFPSKSDLVSAIGGDDSSWTMWRGQATRAGYQPAVKDAAKKTLYDDPAHDKIQWSIRPDGFNTFYSSPSVVGNRVYTTSARWELFKKDGGIYCLDADTGKIVWSYRTGYRATFSSPAISGNYLVVGEGLHETRDARVFCLDLAASEKQRTGVKLWEYRTGSHVESSPCIDGDRAYIGAGDDGVYAIALKPNEQGKANVLWHLPGPVSANPNKLPIYKDCETSPVAFGGLVYWSLGVGGQAVVCVKREDGALVWRVETPYPAFGSPSIAGGKLYVGMGVGDFVNNASALAAIESEKLRAAGKSPQEIAAAVACIRPAGAVWCIDLKTHNVDWKFEDVKDTVLGSVAVDGDRLYFGSRDRNLYCISTAGKLLRKWDAHASIITSPAVGAKYVYTVTESGQLYGLDKVKMLPAWTVSLNSPSFSSPAVARGHVYVGSTNNGLLCVGKEGPEIKPPFWASALGGAGVAGCIDGSMLSARGEFAWGYDTFGPAPAATPANGNGDTKNGNGNGNGAAGETAPAPPPVIYAPAAHVQGAFYIGLNQQSPAPVASADTADKQSDGPAAAPVAGLAAKPQNVYGLAKLNAGNGLANKPVQAWFVPSKNPVYLSAAATTRLAFFVDGRPGDSDRALRCVDAKTGQVNWQLPVAADAAGAFAINETMTLAEADQGRDLTDRVEMEAAVARATMKTRLVVSDTAAGLQAYEIAGQSAPRQLWLAKVGPVVGVPAIDGQLILAAVRQPASLVALDGTSGEVLWTKALTAAPQTGPVLAGDRVWIGQADGVAGYGLYHGKTDLAFKSAAVVGPLVGELELLAAVTADGELLLIDTDKGAEKARLKNVVGTFPPVITSGALLYVTKEAIQRYDVTSRESVQWAKVKASWPGTVVAPMILVDSYLITATDKKGLVCMKPKKQ